MLNHNKACKLFNIHLYATPCFKYFRGHRRMFSIDMNININIHDVYDIFIRQCV